MKLKIALIFGNVPNYEKDAFKYFILELNKLQQTYEFSFPDLMSYPFENKTCTFKTANTAFEDFIHQNSITADYSIAINTCSFDNNYFFKAGDNSAILTTDVWDKYFSPPSLFEYLMHTIITCLLYSKKLPKERKLTDEMGVINIGSHRDTRGCIADFTRNKSDDRVDILLGYICEEHQKEIEVYYGKQYLNEILIIIDRKWIGSIDEKGTVAYNLKHVFKFDINKDSGFNKTLWEKCQDKFYEIPGNIVGEVLKVLLTAIVTYLLIKYGVLNKP